MSNTYIAHGAVNLLSSFVGEKRCAVLISPSINKIYGKRLKSLINCTFFVLDTYEQFILSSFDLVIGIGGERVMNVVSNCGAQYALVPTAPLGLLGYCPQFIIIDESIIFCMPKNLLASGIAKLMAQGKGEIMQFAKNVYKRSSIRAICETMLTTKRCSIDLAHDMAVLIKADIPMGRKLLRCTEFLYGSNSYDEVCNNIYLEPKIDRAQLVLAQHFALKRRLENQKVVNI